MWPWNKQNKIRGGKEKKKKKENYYQKRDVDRLEGDLERSQEPFFFHFF